jgi:hypothetical protein
MLARRELPSEYASWNKKWGAPRGRGGIPGVTEIARRVGVNYQLAPLFGPFAYQWNSSTRSYEFPWVYYALRPRPGLRALEIGGALSGLQFVLARAGCEVHNVDPFVNYGDGDYQSDPQRRHDQLNRAFKTDVTLHKSTLPEARLEGTFNVIYSVSTIEHIPREALTATLVAARQLLDRGGRIVLSVDLFLDLEPFCRREKNRWGSNVSLKWVADVLEMELTEGDPSELCGYDEFSTEAVLENLADYAMNVGYPQLAQLMVFSAS